jgi:hypothetical protein
MFQRNIPPPEFPPAFTLIIMLGLFDPEDRGDMFLINIADFKSNKWHYVPEDRNLHIHCCKNLKSYKISTDIDKKKKQQ